MHSTYKGNNFSDPILLDHLPTLSIDEQPMKNYRFRYKSEQEVIACLYGENEMKVTPRPFPSVRLSKILTKLWTEIEITASCVTHDLDKPKAHPNKLLNTRRVRLIVDRMY